MPTDSFLTTVRRIASGEGTIGNLRAAIEADPNNLKPIFSLLSKLEKFNAREEMKAVIADLSKKIEAGKGYNANNLDSVFALYQDLKRANLIDLAKQQATVLARLDPEGKSARDAQVEV